MINYLVRMHAHIAVLTATSGDRVASEWDPDCWLVWDECVICLGLLAGGS